MKSPIILLSGLFLVCATVATNSQAQIPKSSDMEEELQEQAEKDNTKAKGLVPSGNANISFINGEVNHAFCLGLQENFGTENFLPDINFEFDTRLPKIANKKWLLDYVSVKARFALTLAPAMNLVKTGIGYVANSATDLIGFQAFKNPTVSDMLNFSAVQGAINLNLLRTIPANGDKKIKAFACLNWTGLVNYTPTQANGIADDVADVLEEVNNRINALTTGIVGSVVNANEIRKLSDVANSIKEIPQSLKLRDLRLGFVGDVLNAATGVGDSRKKGDPLYLFYTGPSVFAGSSIPDVPVLSISGYAQYLFSLTKLKAHKKVYLLETASVLDSLYRPLLEDLNLYIESANDVEKTTEYRSPLFVFGFVLSANFYAADIYVAYQGVRLMKEPEFSDYEKVELGGQRFSSAISLGLNFNLARIFKKAESAQNSHAH